MKKLLIAMALLLVGVVAAAYLQPRVVIVERSVVIDRPAAVIFPWLNSWERFNDWSPWFPKDPSARYERSGPARGPGATHSWEGNDEVGKGRTEVVSEVSNQNVVIRLSFEGMPTSMYRFELSPEGTGTRVRWILDADMGNNPIGRWFGLAMDGMVGQDYETGLANLKRVIEAEPLPSPVEPTETPADMPNESAADTPEEVGASEPRAITPGQ